VRLCLTHANPGAADESREVRLPTFALSTLTLNDFLVGAVFLALPQVSLTLGNAIIAIIEENNLLFPHRRVNESKISASTGLINLLGANLGGVPMCHGAGGIASHVGIRVRAAGYCCLFHAAARRDARRGGPLIGTAAHPPTSRMEQLYYAWYYETDVPLPAFSANDRWGVELTPLGAVAMRRVPHQSRPSPRLSTARLRGRSG
jgi:MFS superfamily molybdate transporter